MRLGSKHESEASFSFQINDAVKGDEEYLLAEDDFLRDVNDYTLTTPAPLPRTTVLDHAEPIMLGHQRTRTGDCASAASSPPKLFAPSSPTRANVHHHEAAVTRRLKTPKATSTFPQKPSTPRTTRSTAKRPLLSQEMNLPRPEASPAVARLENLRAEIEMLGESDGLSDASAQQQQYGRSSDRRTESGNRSPLSSDIPTPTKLEIAPPIQKEALMSINEPRSGIPILAQSVPAGEPHSLSSPSSCDDSGEPVSPDTDMNAENTTGKQDIVNSQNLISAVSDKDGRNEVLNITEVEAKNGQGDGLVTPLTLSQLSPRKPVTNANLDDQGPVPSSSTAALMSPMRQSRKRPVSAVATDPYDGQSKKGKTVHRTTQNRVITSKEPDSVNPSGPIRRRNAATKVDVKSHGGVVRRRISSGSRLRSSQLSSSTATAVPSASLASSSRQEHNQKTARTRGNRLVEPRAGLAQTTEVSKEKQKCVAAETPSDAEDTAPPLSGPEDSISESDTFQGQEVVDQLNITLKSRQPTLSAAGDSSRNNDVAGHLAQQGTTSHVNATKSADFQFQFRLEGQKQRLPFEERAGPRLRSHSRNQNPPSVSLLRTSKSTMASSSLSNSRSVASMTRSQFKYTNYRPPPDFKAQHSLLESRTRRKENVAPTVPISFELHTDARARERERFNATVREKEKEMELEREAKRKEREEQEEKDVRERRRRAVPKANVVPEWYKDAPRRKGHVGRERDGGTRGLRHNAEPGC